MAITLTVEEGINEVFGVVSSKNFVVPYSYVVGSRLCAAGYRKLNCTTNRIDSTLQDDCIGVVGQSV